MVVNIGTAQILNHQSIIRRISYGAQGYIKIFRGRPQHFSTTAVCANLIQRQCNELPVVEFLWNVVESAPQILLQFRSSRGIKSKGFGQVSDEYYHHDVLQTVKLGQPGISLWIWLSPIRRPVRRKEWEWTALSYNVKLIVHKVVDYSQCLCS